MELLNYILLYSSGLLFCSGLIIIWNFSSISIHLLSWIYKNQSIITIDELAEAISEKNPKISELLFCPLCLGFWVSVATSTLIFYLNNISYWFIPIASFSWPLFILLIYKHIEKS